MTDEVRNRLLKAIEGANNGSFTDEGFVDLMLYADPALSDAIGLGLAWAECEAAVGPDNMIWVGRGAHGYTARSDSPPGVQTPKSPRAHGATPTEALQRLAVALGEREGARL